MEGWLKFMKNTKNNINTLILSFFIIITFSIASNLQVHCQIKTDKGLKIYILTDLEGVSGVVTFANHSYSTGAYYEQSKILLTKEVNAAVEGALEAGATEITVWDGHGSGGINIDYIHPEAKVVMGRFSDGFLKLDPSFDAFMFIGQHPMSNAPNGNLAHSFSSRTINNIWLNGKLIGEIGALTLYASYFNIPTIFLSGDDVACKEIEELIPNIETVAVKKGLGLNGALNLSPEIARLKIKEGIKRAIEKRNKIKLYKISPPYEVVIEYKDKESADNKAKQPGWNKIDSLKCSFKTNDYLSIKW